MRNELSEGLNEVEVPPPFARYQKFLPDYIISDPVEHFVVNFGLRFLTDSVGNSGSLHHFPLIETNLNNRITLINIRIHKLLAPFIDIFKLVQHVHRMIVLAYYSYCLEHCHVLISYVQSIRPIAYNQMSFVMCQPPSLEFPLQNILLHELTLFLLKTQHDVIFPCKDVQQIINREESGSLKEQFSVVVYWRLIDRSEVFNKTVTTVLNYVKV
jgi:hypothetical protein